MTFTEYIQQAIDRSYLRYFAVATNQRVRTRIVGLSRAQPDRKR